MIAETQEDVQGAESSTAEIMEPEVVQLTQEDLQDPEPEVQALEEVSEEVEESEAPEEKVVTESVETPTKTVPKIPLPRLQKEISKRKELQKQLDELRAKEPSQTQEITHEAPLGEEPTMPTLASSGYDETAYQAAMATYSKDLVRHEIKASQLQANERANKKAQEDARMTHQNRIESFMTENEGYQQVLQEIVESEEDIEYPPAVAQAIELSERGPELDYLILKNRDTVLTKLQGLQPFQQLIELGRLEAQLDSQKLVAKQKPTSKAPTPIKSGTSGSRNTSSDVLKQIDPHFKIY